MANTKNIFLPFQGTGIIGAYMRVRQESTGFYLDNVDGAFRAVPATPNIPLTESLGLPSVYYKSENRTVWITDSYGIVGYDSTNALICGATMYIVNDLEVSQSTLMEYMDFMYKVEGGNWELVDDKWIYYDTNGTTILRQFNLKDASGNPTMTNIFKRERI